MSPDTDVLYQFYTFADVLRLRVVLERIPASPVASQWRCRIRGAMLRFDDGTEEDAQGLGRSPEDAVVHYASHVQGARLAVYDGPGTGATLYDVPLFRRKS